MQEPDQDIIEAQKKVAAFLTRPRPAFEPKSAERLAEEQARSEEQALQDAEVGDIMPDGSVFAGVSPRTGRKIYALPHDAGIMMNFNEAAKYARQLNKKKALGHSDWHVPTQEELDVLFRNRGLGALKDTFNTGDSMTSGWYLSSTTLGKNPHYGWCQRFKNGEQDFSPKSDASSVRFVRTIKGP